MEEQAEMKKTLSAEEALRLARHDPAALRLQLSRMHPSDIADLLLDCREAQERHQILALTPRDLHGEILLALPEAIREDLLSDLGPFEIEELVSHLDSDDVTDILQSLDENVADVVVRRMPTEERREIEPLLAHDEESAGGLMQAELFKVRDTWTVDKVLNVLRRWGRKIENPNYVYVVDEEDRLLGVVPLHELVFADPETNILQLADPNFPKVKAGEDQEVVARIFEDYDVMAVPVVDDRGVLVGRITFDDILDVVQEEATEDMLRLASLSGEDDLPLPVATTAWRRGVWLFVNLVTAIIASLVIAQFQQTIDRIVALAVLMPIVASMGGIAGTQTLTVIVRGIALGHVTFANAKRVLFKEVAVSLVTGICFALLVGAIAAFWFPELGVRIGLVIAAAMLINLLAAGLAGAVIPVTLQRLHIDPALASGTILTTVTDVVGFASFLGLATAFLL